MSLRSTLPLALALLLVAPLSAQPTVGDRTIDNYFRLQVEQIADESLADVKNLDEWKKKRPELRRQFLHMLGLWPMPERTDLHATITGTVDRGTYTIEKLHYQSIPGLYVSANLYVPKKIDKPLPAIVYVCGHAGTTIDKKPHGNKINYQHHPIWYAEHGYVCMIVDTLQLGEIEGIHHGLYRYGMWWWLSRGYTPAGVECWNAMRALDYLETRKEVDPKRMGVTGRSGGGATSWWLGAADERVQCIVPVAGLSDLHGHVVEGELPRFRKGVITGHCDCMYFVNTYRWDFDKVIALCAPRALMLGNSDTDGIFPVGGYRRPSAKARRIYEMYGASNKFVLSETQGPHRDTPELRLGAYRWMNTWLKGDDSPVTEVAPERLEASELKVFDKLPEDAINRIAQEQFLKTKRIEMPQNEKVVVEWWKGKKPQLLEELEETVFRGWPKKPTELDVRPAGETTHEGLRLRAFDFVSQEGISLRLWLLTSAKVEKPTLVVLNALGEADWKELGQTLGPKFAKLLQMDGKVTLDETASEQTRRALEINKWAFAYVAPRGIGPTRWSDTSPHIRRRHALIGQTLDGQRVWDVRRALACLRTLDDVRGLQPWLQGKKIMAGIVLYASLFEDDVARLDLWDLPTSHTQGPFLLNVQRILDMPQALALAFPMRVRLYVENKDEEKAWAWPLRLQHKHDEEWLKLRVVPK